MKRIFCVLLCLVLAIGLLPAAGGQARAASEEAQAAAERLYELGLFSGTGTDANGDPIFELDRAPTRLEAITMLVRLLGKENAAREGSWQTPFTDVAGWAAPYVGYAYENQLTKGTSDTTFSGGESVSAAQYITFVLRALGYSSESDFRWNSSWELSDQLSITDGRYNGGSAVFTRGDVAIISASALDARLKGGSETLLEALIRTGAVIPAICPLNVVRQPASLRAVDGVEPHGYYYYGREAVISADLSDAPGLAYSLVFGDNTEFTYPDKLPAGYDPEALLEWGKYPGLNVDILQKYGFTGKGSVIAYVDQPVAPHEEYDGDNIHIMNNAGSDLSMHGPAVLSLLSGKNTGIATEAEIYYYSFAPDQDAQRHEAECLYQIIEQNKSLPEDKRIRMVGFSDNIDPSEAHADEFQEAADACQAAGIMVWFCGENGAVSFLPGSDKNDYRNLILPSWGGGMPSLVYVPAGGRTTAATMSGNRYIYWSDGGLSWTMPYTLGLYAIALGIDPSLSQDALREMIVSTAYFNDAGMKIVNPIGFVAAVLEGVGRGEEAERMLAEAAARTRYLYAVMDRAALSEEDLDAIGDHLAAVADVTVLVVDAARFSDAQSLYSAMRKDAEQRGGTVAGVQIFGTPDMVPAFQIKYKVQMPDAVDEGDWILTDFFYGSFENDAKLLGESYNVMDHMAEGWDVSLLPRWPVARLPLEKGEYAAFLRKYADFALESGLQRLDIVNFSNPIFPSPTHTDDMGRFLMRAEAEFGILDIPYRLYGNLKGQYPVTYDVLGGFEAENLSAENARKPVEFLINTHGQWNNIDNAVFVDGQEQRISMLNMDNIDDVLGVNPYYLDAWTCLNGYGMQNNLTTAALAGKCVGMFSATTVISNNGVNWEASIPVMAKSNFYYFYYHYLKALHEGQSRSGAFFAAQREYADALLAESQLPLRGEGNYQFNLYNLLAYHNFGVIEPNAAVLAICESSGDIAASSGGARRPIKLRASDDTPVLSEGAPVGEAKTVAYSRGGSLLDGKTLTVEELTVQPLDNGYLRFTLRFVLSDKMNISVFNPPQGSLFMFTGTGGIPGAEDRIVFDLKLEDLKTTEGITIMFYLDEIDRTYIFMNSGQF